MTRTTKIIILDCSAPKVIITTCEHNPADDLEEAVSERMDELELNMDECSWMELPDYFTTEDITII